MLNRIRLSHSIKKAVKITAIFIAKTTLTEFIKQLIKYFFDMLKQTGFCVGVAAPTLFLNIQ